MSEKILVPVLGESITEATVAKWLKSKGETVEIDEPIVEEKIVSSDEVIVTESIVKKNNGTLLIDIISELDPGDGAPVDEVLKKAGDGAEERLQLLIREGEVFELRAGKVKVLE